MDTNPVDSKNIVNAYIDLANRLYELTGRSDDIEVTVSREHFYALGRELFSNYSFTLSTDDMTLKIHTPSNTIRVTTKELTRDKFYDTWKKVMGTDSYYSGDAECMARELGL